MTIIARGWHPVGVVDHLAASVDTSSTEFLAVEDGVRLRARATHIGHNAWFRFDGYFRDTLWTLFDPLENAVAGDSGAPGYKFAWSSRLLDVADSGDQTKLDALWVADWLSAANCNTQIFVGQWYGKPIGRYLYMRVRLDRSGVNNPSLSANASAIYFDPPIPVPDSIEVTLDSVSPFAQLRALRRQPRYVTFQINNRDLTPVNLTGIHVQLFLRDSDDVSVGPPYQVNVVTPTNGQCDLQFGASDLDLPAGSYKAEIIAWKQPNFVRREFALVIEQSAVPVGWDPTLVISSHSVPFDVR